MRSGDGQSAGVYFTANTDYCGGSRLAAQKDGFQLKLTGIELRPIPTQPPGTRASTFILPRAQGRMKVLNGWGEVVDVLAEGIHLAGQHRRDLNTDPLAVELYFASHQAVASGLTHRMAPSHPMG